MRVGQFFVFLETLIFFITYSEDILTIVALLSGESIFITSLSKRTAAREAHQKFASSEGDHITLLQVYRNYRNIPQESVSIPIFIRCISLTIVAELVPYEFPQSSKSAIRYECSQTVGRYLSIVGHSVSVVRPGLLQSA